MGTELLRQSFEIQGRNFDKAGEISSEIKVILKDLGIDAANVRRLVIVAFEAEMNVVMYANSGIITFILTDDDIKLKIADEGPGIPDINLALQEGYSTASKAARDLGFGAGLGLPNIRKSSDFFTISFEPTFPGDKWAIITIVNNDPDDDPFTFRVEGMVGLPPVVDIEVWEGATYCPDGSTYSGFGTVSVGSSSAPVTFYIWNNGPDDLVIPNIVMTGGDILDFDLDLNVTDLNVPIPPGGFTVFTVTFIPSSSGTKWLDLNINYNDPVQTPYQLRLEGEGDD